jgi:hypothetical protein
MNETAFSAVEPNSDNQSSKHQWLRGFIKILYAPVEVGQMSIPSPIRPILFGVLIWVVAALASEAIMSTNPVLVQQQTVMAENDVRALGRAGRIDEETLDRQIEENRPKTKQSIPWSLSIARSVLYGFISVFGVGILFWVLQRLFNAEPPSVLSIVTIVAYGFSIDGIDAIARAIMMTATGSVFATPSLAFLVAPYTTALSLVYTLLSKLNIFTMWEYLVLGLAVAAHVKMPRKFGFLFGIAAFIIVYGAIATVAMIYIWMLSAS